MYLNQTQHCSMFRQGFGGRRVLELLKSGVRTNLRHLHYMRSPLLPDDHLSFCCLPLTAAKSSSYSERTQASPRSVLTGTISHLLRAYTWLRGITPTADLPTAAEWSVVQNGCRCHTRSGIEWFAAIHFAYRACGVDLPCRYSRRPLGKPLFIYVVA